MVFRKIYEERKLDCEPTDEFRIITEVVDSMDYIVYENTNYKTKFGFGTKKDLLDFLENNKKRVENSSILKTDSEGVEYVDHYYPLIWLITPTKIKGEHGYYNTIFDPVFMVANLNENKDEVNESRLDKNFDKIINPCFNEFISKLLYHPLTKFKRHEVNSNKHFNFAVYDDGKYNDVWDALEVDFELKLKTN